MSARARRQRRAAWSNHLFNGTPHPGKPNTKERALQRLRALKKRGPLLPTQDSELRRLEAAGRT
jgi:hypothetical protein